MNSLQRQQCYHQSKKITKKNIISSQYSTHILNKKEAKMIFMMVKIIMIIMTKWTYKVLVK